jgi:phage terminase Nu1 subunit (DNA packaging protein)
MLKPKIKGSKPKLGRSNGDKPRWQLDKEYVSAKIDLIRVREKSAALLLARARDELIETDLVTKQAAFLLTAMRQKLLAIPNTYARKLLHKENPNEVAAILKDAIHLALREIADLPRRAVNPNWLKTLDEDE